MPLHRGYGIYKLVDLSLVIIINTCRSRCDANSLERIKNKAKTKVYLLIDVYPLSLDNFANMKTS